MAEGNVLTREIAEQFLVDEDSVTLDVFSQIEDAAAESLSRHQGYLCLDGLKTLSDAAAESLSKHRGDLYLDGLETLSDAAAKSFSKHRGNWMLRGLAGLSNAAADALRELIHPAVTGTGVPLYRVSLPHFEKGEIDSETYNRQARVNLIQSLIDDMEQVAYLCGCTHQDEAGGALTFALVKFAYRNEAVQNGGRITKEIANAMKSGLDGWGFSSDRISC